MWSRSDRNFPSFAMRTHERTKRQQWNVTSSVVELIYGRNGMCRGFPCTVSTRCHVIGHTTGNGVDKQDHELCNLYEWASVSNFWLREKINVNILMLSDTGWRDTWANCISFACKWHDFNLCLYQWLKWSCEAGGGAHLTKPGWSKTHIHSTPNYFGVIWA